LTQNIARSRNSISEQTYKKKDVKNLQAAEMPCYTTEKEVIGGFPLLLNRLR